MPTRCRHRATRYRSDAMAASITVMVAHVMVMAENQKITITALKIGKCKFLEEKSNILFA